MSGTRVIGFLVALIVVACSRSEAATEPTVAAGQVATAMGATHETANYKASIEAEGPFKKGEKNVVKVVLVTKGDYHINKQYPYKFAVQEPAAEGVTYPEKVVRRDAGTFEERRAVIPVSFVAEKAGEVKVGGLFSLSVCTDANCLLDKQALELSVNIAE